MTDSKILTELFEYIGANDLEGLSKRLAEIIPGFDNLCQFRCKTCGNLVAIESPEYFLGVMFRGGVNRPFKYLVWKHIQDDPNHDIYAYIGENEIPVSKILIESTKIKMKEHKTILEQNNVFTLEDYIPHLVKRQREHCIEYAKENNIPLEVFD